MKIHKNITAEDVMNAVEDSTFGLANPGFCIKCGEDADGVEPDAREYKCAVCGELGVYGAEELLFHL